MRHRVQGRKLKRTASHRKAMLKNMATSLLKYERIRTTTAKAKELRTFVEPIITKAKVDSLHNKREVLKKIRDRKILVKLFEDIALRYKDRPGGYTRIIKLATTRPGDNSKMCYIELVEEAISSKPAQKKSAPKNVEEKVETVVEEKEAKVEAEEAPAEEAKAEDVQKEAEDKKEDDKKE